MKCASERDFLSTVSDWPDLWDEKVDTFLERKYEEDTSSDWLVVLKGWIGCVEPGKRRPMVLQGYWEEAHELDHLGVHVGKIRMCVFVADSKERRVLMLAERVLILAKKNSWIVPLHFPQHFCVVCGSLTLGLPLERFYTRYLCFYMSCADLEDREQIMLLFVLRLHRRIPSSTETFPTCAW